MAPPLLPESTVSYLPMPEADQNAEEELRLAVVLNGGVSLAVWMGGVVLELQRLTCRQGVYGRLLDALSSRARADVIAGTSAGGINGAALAVGQAYPDSDVARLRDVWAEEGALIDLLQDPWSGQPASLLKGDAKFLPALRAAFAELLTPANQPGANAYSPETRPIHLTLTTTLLTASERTITDALGQSVSQPSHNGRFRFLRSPEVLGWVDDFAAPVGDLADRLGLAARCTASFPIAFEPVHVRIGPATAPADSGTPAPDRAAPPEHPRTDPDMSAHANFSVSRWVVDGGVLMNTPLRSVLEAIQAAPAGIQVRRALLLVVPDPYRASAEERAPESADERPTLARTLSRIVSSVESQTVAEELRMIQERNVRAQARRDSRTDMLATITGGGESVAEDLSRLADTLFGNYRDLRIWRAASGIAAQAAPILGEPAERLAHDVRNALRDARGNAQHLPWVPDTFDQGLGNALAGNRSTSASPGTTGDWGWGLATLERLTVAVHDLLKRAIWVMPSDGEARGRVMQLREQHSRITAQLLALRNADSAYWQDRARRVRANQPTGVVPRAVLIEALRAGLEEWDQGLWAFVQAPVGAGRPAGGPEGPAVPPLAEIAARLLSIANAAASWIPPDLPDPDGVLQADRLVVLRRVFAAGAGAAPTPSDPEPAMDVEQALRAALGLEVCYLCLVESDDPTASEQAIDLVRISAGVEQPFAPGMEATDRVTGLRLGHFAAFLKQTWRVNDWTWGRLDAANRMVWLLLDPLRLRRRVLLAGPAAEVKPGPAVADAGPTRLPDAPPGSPAARRLLATILGSEPSDAWVDVLALLDGEMPLGLGREVLQPLADHLIRELAAQIVAEEEGALLTAVQVDASNGENPMSAGARWRDSRYPPAAGPSPAFPTMTRGRS